MSEKLSSVKILGTSITTASKAEMLEFITKRLKSSKEKFYIVTPNPEILLHASRSSSFQKVLNNASVSLPDGVGVLMAGNILKKEISARVTGIDFMLELCKECARMGLSIGLLGGRDGVANKTAECLVKMYPDLRVNLVAEEWKDLESGPAAPHPQHQSSDSFRAVPGGPPVASPDDMLATPASPVDRKNQKLKTQNSSIDQKSINQLIDNSDHIDILFVAFGFPKQEEWIAKNLTNIPVTAAMGVGGAFDYISGKVVRAPRAVRSAGMEWAFRLVRQPWRIKRQSALPIFAYKILQEKFRNNLRNS